MFRVTIGTEIIHEISTCLRLIVVANFKKDSSKQHEEAQNALRELRSRIEILRAFFVLGWEIKIFSHGFFAVLSERLEEVSKQAASWEKWLVSKQKKG